jgi:hypothetical protein
VDRDALVQQGRALMEVVEREWAEG